MRRRRVLAALGAAASLAGCSGSGGDGGPAADGERSDGADGTGSDSSATANGESVAAAVDGYPPTSAIEEVPPAPEYDPASFDTVTYEGTTVPLVPIDVAYDWYRRREARFADARPTFAYERAHVLGAVSSPAPTGKDGSDPVATWPTDARIVAYCGCPHHLSSMRAGTLLSNGYEEVYALDEGFGEWVRRSYPMAGTKVRNRRNLENQPAERVIRGSVPASSADGYAWARHEPTGQAEAAPIGTDGGYEIHLQFWEITPQSTITVETPAYTVTAPLRDLTTGRVTAADAGRVIRRRPWLLRA